MEVIVIMEEHVWRLSIEVTVEVKPADVMMKTLNNDDSNMSIYSKVWFIQNHEFRLTTLIVVWKLLS